MSSSNTVFEHSELARFNQEQQEAITCTDPVIKCVAGAGTGKTTVLTQRIRHLVSQGVDPSTILAITFTRKARDEMQHRLKNTSVTITTFNSFCERYLRSHGQEKPVLAYRQKVQLFHDALRKTDRELKTLINEYFSFQQRKGTSQNELAHRLIADVFSILDHFSNEDAPIPSKGNTVLASDLLSLARTIQEIMDDRGIRDFSGQLREALAFMRSYPNKIPSFDHILVDEYQDINHAQSELLKLLSPPNLFVVGDPRQSIFGWRGSKISYISDHPGTTIQLKENYRSASSILDAANLLIAPMGLTFLKPQSSTVGAVQMLKHDTQREELAAIVNLLKATTSTDIFVLARTNRQLMDLSTLLRQNDIAHTIKHEHDDASPDTITLATVHAIKGLEAGTVIVFGVTSQYFPCRVSDHPVVDIVKDNSHDKEAEERRLLYVAMTRAKETLIITHAGKRSYFLDDVFPDTTQKKLVARDDKTFQRLRKWRLTAAAEKNLPAYCIVSDKTLREITEVRPQTLDELHKIHGIGFSKIKQFGDQILDVLHSI